MLKINRRDAQTPRKWEKSRVVDAKSSGQLSLLSPRLRVSAVETKSLKAEKTTARPLVFSAFLLGALTAVATPARAQDAATLLGQMRAAEAKAQYSGTLFIVRNGQRETANVYRDGTKRRWEWTAPALKKGDLLVDDGKNLYLYHRSENSVTQTQSTPFVPGAGADWKVARANGDFVLSRGAQKLTIDGTRKILLRFENGGAVYALQNLKFGAQSDAKFGFSTPKGAKVVRSKGKLFVDLASARGSAGWLKAPAKLPSGFVLESVVAAPDEVWLRYSDGKRRFSLFEQRAEAGTVELTEVKGGYFWKTGGTRYVASGVSQNTAQSLAGSLK